MYYQVNIRQKAKYIISNISLVFVDVQTQQIQVKYTH
jgi:hypothetical protein